MKNGRLIGREREESAVLPGVAARTSLLELGNCCLKFMPSLHRELCWPGHRLKTD